MTVGLSDCTVQEVRAPLPKEILYDSLPDGFEPASHGRSGASALGESVTTSFACPRFAVTEIWLWVPVVPPRALRDPSITEYGFLISGHHHQGRSLLASGARCMDAIFERARISFHLGTVGSKEKMEVRSEAKTGSHEVHSTALPDAGRFSRRARLFSLAKNGAVQSVDIKMAARSTSVGEGVDIQNADGLWAEDQTVLGPGVFSGQATHLFQARVMLQDRTAFCG